MTFFKKPKQDHEDNMGNSTKPLSDSDQLKKIADHLGFLERKIDQLLDASRGQRKPFGQRFGGSDSRGNGDFQRPRNNFRSNNSYGRPSGGNRPYGQGRPDSGRPQEGNRPHDGNRPSYAPRHARQS